MCSDSVHVEWVFRRFQRLRNHGQSDRLAMALTAALALAPAQAKVLGEEPFLPPEQYPESRYEAGWEKNPFTLKTAPVSIQKESFAKDLALGSVTKIDGHTKVVVVNTKTMQRTTVWDGEPSKEGFKLGAVNFGASRREISAVLEFNGETATLRYDSAVLKQFAARSSQSAGKAETLPKAPQGQFPGTQPLQSVATPPNSQGPLPTGVPNLGQQGPLPQASPPPKRRTLATAGS